MGVKSVALVLFLACLASCEDTASPAYSLPSTTGAPDDYLSTTSAVEDNDSTTQASINASSFRLPENLRPEHYVIDIKTFMDGEDSHFEGRVQIRVIVAEETSKVVLHTRSINVTTDEVKVTNAESGHNLEIESHDFDIENNFYIIHLKEALNEGEKYLVDIPYNAPLRTTLSGYYKSSYVDKESGKTKWMGITQFEPTDARRAFPCFDEPAMKAIFQVNLIRQKSFSSISNMPLSKTTPLSDDWFKDEYVESVRMSTYLVAFAVSEFAYLESTPGNTTFRTWARPDAINQASYSLDIGPKILDFFGDYFAVPYPLPKMDMIAIPDFSSGAMENWGLVTYRETAMLYEEGVSPATSKESVTRVVAHELAHQWFGNLVTMKWWDDLWLNEGFATYVAALGTAHAQPTWDSLNDQMVESMLSVFSADALQSSHPVSATINHPSEILQNFDSISYSKGAFLLRMMSHFLGEGTFKRGVTRYLKAHQYSNAAQDSLWACLEEQAQLDSAIDAERKATAPGRATVKEVMDSWTLKTGYPVMTVVRHYENNSAHFRQERFLTDWYGRSSDEDGVWWIPISYTDSSEVHTDLSTRPRLWMNEQVAEIEGLPDKDHWLLLNINATSLYRVNYDAENWQLLSLALRSQNHGGIPYLNRVQMVDDAMDLARAGLLDYSLALDLLRYLRHERKYLPWRAAFSNFVYFNRMTRRTPGYGAFREFMQTLLTPIYKELGENPFRARKEEDLLTDTKQRSQLLSWSCAMGVDDCESRASELFKAWQKEEDPDLVNPIPVDLRELAYCNGIKLGGQAGWDFAWQRYLKSNNAAEKGKLLSALGCTQDVWLLNKYLEMSLDESSGIRKQDAISVFYSVARSSGGFYVAREFLFSRITDIHTYYASKPTRLSRYLAAISESMNTEYELEQMKRFTGENALLFMHVKRGVKQALENIQVNKQWRMQYYSTLVQWLKDHANEKYFA